MLDSVGETYHHLALCPRHHRMVDDMGFDSGLVLQGYAYTENGRVIYSGPDEYLSTKYPKEGHEAGRTDQDSQGRELVDQ